MSDALPLSAWESFYVIDGSSGAALIGLQFVVIALVADLRNGGGSEAMAAFGTPTVVHFGGALVVSALMSAPWPSLAAPAIALGIFGLCGIVFGSRVMQRARRQDEYAPVPEDWLWFVIFPTLAYAVIATGSLSMRHSALGEFLVGGAALALLLIGIHNAWDSVTHIVSLRGVVASAADAAPRDAGASPPPTTPPAASA